MFFILFSFLSISISLSSSPAHSKVITNTHIYNHITPQSWKNAAISYFHDFPYNTSYNNLHIKGCSKYTNPSSNTPVLRCTEHINLLRPNKVIKAWQLEQKQKGYINLNIPEFGVINQHAHITSVTKTKLDTSKIDWNNERARPVIGTFERHVLDVRTYTVKDSKGIKEHINVTPNHRFYVKNREVEWNGRSTHYIPIGEIDRKDEMIDEVGSLVRLECGGRDKHCGEEYNKAKPTLVYNIEVYGKHNYYVGKMETLVHNVCGGGEDDPANQPGPSWAYEAPEEEEEPLAKRSRLEDEAGPSSAYDGDTTEDPSNMQLQQSRPSVIVPNPQAALRQAEGNELVELSNNDRELFLGLNRNSTFNEVLNQANSIINSRRIYYKRYSLIQSLIDRGFTENVSNRIRRYRNYFIGRYAEIYHGGLIRNIPGAGSLDDILTALEYRRIPTNDINKPFNIWIRARLGILN